MSNNKTENTEFGVVGELAGEPIHYKEGKQQYGNYLPECHSHAYTHAKAECA